MILGISIFATKSVDGGPPSLGLPIECTLGIDCWLVNLFDHDPSKGVRDFRCSDHLYDGHKGTDIGIRDLGAMRKGVYVLAAAPGEVVALRDGMLDHIPSADLQLAANRFCGNGIVIRHNAGWETQYCHLKRESILVKRGQKVVRGQPIGLVGHSGMTMFPHIHLSIRYNEREVDPFVGLNREKPCEIGERPLWRASVLRALSQDMTAIYNVGFAAKRPNVRSIREGLYRDLVFSRNIPALIFWAEIFWVRPGDKVRIRIFGPDGELVIDHRSVVKRRQARWMIFSGRKRLGLQWPSGQYRGEVLVEREETNARVFRYKAESNIILKN